MQPYLDKAIPEAWAAAEALSTAVRLGAEQRGLTSAEIELIDVRASQLNVCVYCLDLHSRRARNAGVEQQKLDMLPAWRETELFSEREEALLAIVEATTLLPPTDDSQADLIAARHVLGEEVFVAAEWVAVTINTFNRISILSGHPVRAR